jgi:hypothetical protein
MHVANARMPRLSWPEANMRIFELLIGTQLGDRRADGRKTCSRAKARAHANVVRVGA